MNETIPPPKKKRGRPPKKKTPTIPPDSQEEDPERAVAQDLRDRFPPLDESLHGRSVYFTALDALTSAFLRGRGYNPVAVYSLPQNTAEQRQAYLRAYAQGVMEHTIVPPKGYASTLRVSYDEAGMLGKKDKEERVPHEEERGTLEEALNWHKTRHTMDNSTHSMIEEKS